MCVGNVYTVTYGCCWNLNQCWPRFLTQYSITKPGWVKLILLNYSGFRIRRYDKDKFICYMQDMVECPSQFSTYIMRLNYHDLFNRGFYWITYIMKNGDNGNFLRGKACTRRQQRSLAWYFCIENSRQQSANENCAAIGHTACDIFVSQG